MINRSIKSTIMRGVERLSMQAVRSIVRQTPGLESMWAYSVKVFPDMQAHFTGTIVNAETEMRIRLLLCCEALFTGRALKKCRGSKACSYADVGDSDGTVQMLLRYYGWEELETTGINLQQSAVDRIRERGLDAICEDAMRLGDRGQSYDVVSVFETLEHLPDPIGFLKGIQSVVSDTLVVSVPYIKQSRVGLAYLSKRWPAEKVPTIENTHILELSPGDWGKIFKHAGWRVIDQNFLLMYPRCSWLRLVLQPYWRQRSFEGFWFVALTRDNRFARRYRIE